LKVPVGQSLQIDAASALQVPAEHKTQELTPFTDAQYLPVNVCKLCIEERVDISINMVVMCDAIDAMTYDRRTP